MLGPQRFIGLEFVGSHHELPDVVGGDTAGVISIRHFLAQLRRELGPKVTWVECTFPYFIELCIRESLVELV